MCNISVPSDDPQFFPKGEQGQPSWPMHGQLKKWLHVGFTEHFSALRQLISDCSCTIESFTLTAILSSLIQWYRCWTVFLQATCYWLSTQWFASVIWLEIFWKSLVHLWVKNTFTYLFMGWYFNFSLHHCHHPLQEPFWNSLLCRYNRFDSCFVRELANGGFWGRMSRAMK